MKRPKAWVVIVFMAMAISFLSSCAVYGVVKEKVLPGAKAVVIAAGPDLFKALIEDVSTILGWPVEKVAGFVGYHGPTDFVPPAK